MRAVTISVAAFFTFHNPVWSRVSVADSWVEWGKFVAPHRYRVHLGLDASFLTTEAVLFTSWYERETPLLHEHSQPFLVDINV